MEMSRIKSTREESSDGPPSLYAVAVLAGEFTLFFQDDSLMILLCNSFKKYRTRSNQ